MDLSAGLVLLITIPLVGLTLQIVHQSSGLQEIRSLALQQASQSLAAIRGREYVLPDDVKELAIFILAHRVLLDTRASVRGLSAGGVIERVVASVPTPVE